MPDRYYVKLVNDGTGAKLHINCEDTNKMLQVPLNKGQVLTLLEACAKDVRGSLCQC